MDRLRGFSIATIVVLSQLLLPLTATWLMETNYMDPLREFCLAAIVLLSIVLLLITNPWGLSRASRRRTYFRSVWVGQSIAAVGGLWVITGPIHPEFGLVVTVIAFLACLGVLGPQMRPVRPFRA